MIKVKQFRSSAYIKWVKTLPCCHCGAMGVDPHHVIGFRGITSGKAGDHFAVPLCREDHTEFHSIWVRDMDVCRKVQLKWLHDTQAKWLRGKR